MITAPTPFEEALQSRKVKRNLPTHLSSAELMRLGVEVRERANFSAKQGREDVLDDITRRVELILNPTQTKRADRITAANPEGYVTTGSDLATARLGLKELGEKIGYIPPEGKAGTIQDHFSDSRLNLILETNVRMAQGYGQFVQANAPEALELYPCWELVRVEDRAVPRGKRLEAGMLVDDEENGWPARFRRAAQAVGDTDALRVIESHERMIARKDSPIWAELSAFGQPYAPFDFNSGMDLVEVDRDQAVTLGVIDELAVIQPQTRSFAI